MMLIKRDDRNRIESAIDYYLIDDNGELIFNGTGYPWVWVNQLEISEGVNGLECIKYFIKKIAQEIPHAVGAYWQRNVKTGEKVHLFRRSQLVKGGRRDVASVV